MSGNRTNLASLQDAYLQRTALEASQPKLLYGRFVQPYPLPVNEGSIVKWFRYLNPDEYVTAAGDDGATPPPITITREELTTEVTEHIWWTQIKSQWKAFDQDKKGQANLLKKLSQVAARSVDTIDATNFVAGTSVYLASNAASRAAISAAPTEADLDYILKTLEESDTEPIESMIDGTVKQGSVPVDEAFIGIYHIHARGHFEKLPNFVPVYKYATADKRLPGEIGAWNGRLRILCTSKGIKIANAASSGPAAGTTWESAGGTYGDVYQGLIFGKDAFGGVPFMSEGGQANFKTIIKGLETGGAENPGNQRGSLALKKWHASRILDETKVVRHEHLCQIRPS